MVARGKKIIPLTQKYCTESKAPLIGALSYGLSMRSSALFLVALGRKAHESSHDCAMNHTPNEVLCAFTLFSLVLQKTNVELFGTRFSPRIYA